MASILSFSNLVVPSLLCAWLFECELVLVEFVLLVLYVISLLPLELVFEMRDDLVVVRVVVVVVALLLLEPKRWQETTDVPLKLPPFTPDVDMNEFGSEGIDARDGRSGTCPGPSTLPVMVE